MARIIRDADEERLARIEQMLEDLRREVTRLNDQNQRVRHDTIVTRENAAQARSELHRAIAASRALRRPRAPRKR
jgi:t-SNARE complex subunit (syntaxin)